MKSTTACAASAWCRHRSGFFAEFSPAAHLQQYREYFDVKDGA
jgi:hypothetical protein